MQLYAGFLQQSLDGVENSSLRDIERYLDPKVILLWRYDKQLSLALIRI